MEARTPKLVTKTANLPNFLLLCSCAVGGMLCALTARKMFGEYGHVAVGIGSFIGLILGVVGSWTIFFSLVKLRVKYFLSLPRCKRDCCYRFGPDYTWRKGTIYGWIDWSQHHFRCKCGDQYLRKGRKFMEVHPDNLLKPYKRLEGWSTWVDDN